MPRTNPGPCAQCGEDSGLQAWCQKCKNVNRKSWAERNPGYWRPKYLASRYGITEADYNDLVEEQGDVCAACGGRHVYRGLDRLIIDHDHATGEIRGLLCEPCNLALGLVEDSPARLQQLANYLDQRR